MPGKTPPPSTQLDVDDFMELEVDRKEVKTVGNYIVAEYLYEKNVVTVNGRSVRVSPQTHRYTFRTKKTPAKTGVMLVGLGGNNGTTMTAGILANKHGIAWDTK